ncbi:MAG: hypothetical protein NWE86_07545 [Candidatus Bathyarchaeota archaeon]|nr:hypothetical protein [Candidatus Bathyarchaeota archaeon]
MKKSDKKSTLNDIFNHVDYAQTKRRRETIYMIFLFISLFSISFIFFSNAITKIDISVDGGTPEYVVIPAMFSTMQVVFLMILTFISTVCFLLLYFNFNKNEKKTKKRNLISNVLEGDEKKLYEIILEKNEILQKDLVYESGFSKVKVTRILRKLDNKKLIIRKPWGNTNKILIK